MADNDNAERLERLIASNEAAANAMNRLAQVLERKEQKPHVKAQRVRRRVERPTVVTDRAIAAANHVIARVKARG